MNMITNIAYVVGTNGEVVQTIVTVSHGWYYYAAQGIWSAGVLATFLMSWWAVKSIWKTFLAGDRLDD